MCIFTFRWSNLVCAACCHADTARRAGIAGRITLARKAAAADIYTYRKKFPLSIQFLWKTADSARKMAYKTCSFSICQKMCRVYTRFRLILYMAGNKSAYVQSARNCVLKRQKTAWRGSFLYIRTQKFCIYTNTLPRQAVIWLPPSAPTSLADRFRRLHLFLSETGACLPSYTNAILNMAAAYRAPSVCGALLSFPAARIKRRTGSV